MNLFRIFFKTYSMYFKVGALILVVSVTMYLSMKYNAARTQAAVDEAVQDTAREFGRALTVERERRLVLQGVVDVKYAVLLTAIGNVGANTKANLAKLEKAIADNPDFYKQPLPPEGYEAWIASRRQAARIASPVPPSASPTPSSQ